MGALDPSACSLFNWGIVGERSTHPVGRKRGTEMLSVRCRPEIKADAWRLWLLVAYLWRSMKELKG